LGGVVTIGIAAFGPNAGRAVLHALRAVEAVARGAIGGFVSFVAITPSGQVDRLQTQHGGSAMLLPGGLASLPVAIAEAAIAGLMASGPDRPEPLSQFTPADGKVGLVTGHRMPNTVGVNGLNLSDEVLALMRRGDRPADAVGSVIAANPDVDAGIIALSIDGGLHAADTASVGRRGDAGRAMIGSAAEGAAVAVLHNAIRPHMPIAALAAEITMDVMRPPDRPDGWITFREGTRAVPGFVNSVSVGADGLVEAIAVQNPKFLAGRWSFGIGYEARVVSTTGLVAAMLYEPYMVLEDGRLSTIDGRAELAVPIRSC
jgi:hypothetical protein